MSFGPRSHLLSRLPYALAFVALALLSPPASAHIGAPEGRAPFVAGDVLLGGGTTWGIIKKSEDRWLRVCEESLGGPPAFYFRQPTAGRILIARADGLWLTDDGCTLEEGPALFANAQPALLLAPRGAVGTIFVATSKAEGDNTLYKSLDEGASFVATALANENVSLRSAAASDDGQDLYVGGIYLDTRAPVVFVSRDGGESFLSAAPFAESTAAANVLGVDPVTGEVALVLLDPDVQGSILALADADLSSLSELAAFDSVASDFLVHDNAWLVIEGRQRLYRRAKSASEFTLVEGGPTRCLLKLPGDERVWGCGQPFQNGHFLVSDDGITFTPELPFLEIEEHRCPAGTLGAERCSYLFEADAGVIDAPDDDDDGGSGPRVERPREQNPPGCPCSGAGSGDVPLLALLLGLFALGRRRQR